jgi:hypothetical protein
MRGLRTAGAFGAAAALAVTSACGFGGGDEDSSDEARLLDMLNEGYRLESEMAKMEQRLVLKCLEDKGHTVHDEWEMQHWGDYEQKQLIDWYPVDDFLPKREIAEKWGFGQWANSEDAWDSPEAEEYQKERWGDDEDDDNWTEPDNSAFEALPKEQRYDWYVAYYGDEKASEQYDWILMDEEDWEDFDEEDWDLENGEDFEGDRPGGELDFDEEEYVEPKPGGCELEMIQALYGEPELVEESWGEETWTYWSYRPERPGEEDDWEELQFAYRDRIIDQEEKFLDCVYDKGRGDWEFDENGYLGIWYFWEQVYYGDELDYGDWEPDWVVPEVPADMPTDLEGRKDYEIAMAVDFVDCGDESGLRESAVEAWEETQISYYLAVEEEHFAWQQQVKDVLEKAQDLLGELRARVARVLLCFLGTAQPR